MTSSVLAYHSAREGKSRVDVGWVQNYDPLGSATLLTMAAGLPIVVLLGMLLAGISRRGRRWPG